MKTRSLRINPLMQNKINSRRKKHILFDVLGSITRTITGNLHAEDAAKHD